MERGRVKSRRAGRHCRVPRPPARRICCFRRQAETLTLATAARMRAPRSRSARRPSSRQDIMASDKATDRHQEIRQPAPLPHRHLDLCDARGPRRMVRGGEDFVVYDAKTGEDITRSVLTQIIFEQENKDGQNLLPITFLRQLIRFYGDSMQALVPSYLEFSMDNLDPRPAEAARADGQGLRARRLPRPWRSRCAPTWPSSPRRCGCSRPFAATRSRGQERPRRARTTPEPERRATSTH